MLPQGFTRVEYIESTGTQYIDTGFKPNQDTRIVMECNIIGGTYPTAFGVWNSSGAAQFICLSYNADTTYFYYGTTTNRPAVTILGKHLIDANKNVLYIDGVEVATAADSMFQCNYGIYLSALNNGGAPREANMSEMQILPCQIYDNGTIVRDYIPCIDENGDANLWDDVNETLAEKVGTFIAGPAIPAPSAPVSLRTALAVRLLWDSVAAAEYYKIYRDGVLIGTTTETQYIDTTAEENATYTYGISAANGGGESAPTELIVYTRSGYFLYKPYISTANFP